MYFLSNPAGGSMDDRTPPLVTKIIFKIIIFKITIFKIILKKIKKN